MKPWEKTWQISIRPKSGELCTLFHDFTTREEALEAWLTIYSTSALNAGCTLDHIYQRDRYRQTPRPTAEESGPTTTNI